MPPSRLPRQGREERQAELRRRLWHPPTHWWLLAACVGAVLVVLFFQGYATNTIGASAEPRPAPGTPAPLQHSRPLLTAEGPRLTSSQPPPGRRVALTFDDGPDATWTPRIAAVLRREHVPAAFFVVGSQAARYPEIVRVLVRDGHEIGNHTFTHTSLTGGPAWQSRLQVDLTEAVIVGITGRYARFLRPPYSATPEAVTPSQERRLVELIGRRYVVVLADFDSEDWRNGGVPKILAGASPPGRTGGIIMFHDGGGDRSRTVTAVSKLIPQLRARGFRFVSLSELARLPESVVSPRASMLERWRGEAFAWSVRSAFLLGWIFAAIVIAVGLLVVARAAIVLLFGAYHSRSTRSRRQSHDYAPSVAIVVPAYNEAVGIERVVRSLASSDYPDFEVVVVDDGSTDETGTIVEGLDLPNVRLVRQRNGGKPGALNTGIRGSASEIVVMVDGDTLFEPETLRRLVQPLADSTVGAVSGNTKVGNRRGLLGRWQHIEYVMGFNLDRRMYDVLQCTPTVPGAVGAFRREALEEIGGVSGVTLAEDTDLTLAIGRTGRHIVYAEHARAWTEAPSTLGGLWRQRYRWSYGTMQAVWKHKGAIVSRDRRQHRVGRRALPYLIFFQIVLPAAAPLIDLFALYGLVFTDPVRVLAYWGGFNVIQLFVAAVAFHLDREPLRALWAVPLQQFVYRQLMYVVVVESTITALVGVRTRWQHVERTGDVEVGTVD